MRSQGLGRGLKVEPNLLAYGLKNGAKVGPGVGTVKDTRCSGVQNSLALLYSVGRYAAPAADPVPVVVRAVL
jgi:hypothetical protein